MLQLANPRHLSGLLHRLCVSLHRLCLLRVSLHLLPISLGCLGCLGGAWHNAWLGLDLCLCLRLWLGEVGV